MGKHVLICDDDAEIIKLVTQLLETEGHQVSAVQDNESIWGVIEAKMPDLIFMDLWMQKMGGEATTRLLKKKRETQKIPVVLLSASRGIEEAAQRAGADGYLAKPFAIKELLNIVNSI